MYNKKELHLIYEALTDETHILSQWLARFEDFNDLEEVKYYKEILKLYNILIRKTGDLIEESED